MLKKKYIAVTPPQHPLVGLALVVGWDWRGYLSGGIPVTMHDVGILVPPEGIGLPESVNRYAKLLSALSRVWYVAADKDRLSRLEAIAMRQGVVLRMLSLRDLGLACWSRELLNAIEDGGEDN